MRASLAVLFLAAAGCSAPAFVANTGRVTPRGSFRVGRGSGYQFNTSAADVVKDGRDLVATMRSHQTTCPGSSTGAQCWQAADVDPVVDAAFRFALVAPFAAHTEISGRYGFLPGLDAGVHWGPDAKSVDLGWQAFGPLDPRADGWAGTALLSYGTRSLGTLGAVIEDVFKGDASLADLQATFVAGRQWREIAHFYGGARYVMTRWKIQVIPDLPIIYDGATAQQELLGTDPDGTIHHYGGVVGGALGYRHVWVGAELNVLRTSGSARVLSKDRTFSGVGVMPALYLYGQY
jgi:hypothetical protein